MKRQVQLYTWQLPDWDITKEKRDPARCPQRWGENKWESLQPLYAKLRKELGTLDLLWCYPAYKHWNANILLKLWVLDVPSCELFRFGGMMPNYRRVIEVGGVFLFIVVTHRRRSVFSLSAARECL